MKKKTGASAPKQTKSSSVKPRGEWDSSQRDAGAYRLSELERVRKKLASRPILRGTSEISTPLKSAKPSGGSVATPGLTPAKPAANPVKATGNLASKPPASSSVAPTSANLPGGSNVYKGPAARAIALRSALENAAKLAQEVRDTLARSREVKAAAIEALSRAGENANGNFGFFKGERAALEKLEKTTQENRVLLFETRQVQASPAKPPPPHPAKPSPENKLEIDQNFEISPGKQTKDLEEIPRVFAKETAGFLLDFGEEESAACSPPPPERAPPPVPSRRVQPPQETETQSDDSLDVLERIIRNTRSNIEEVSKRRRQQLE